MYFSKWWDKLLLLLLLCNKVGIQIKKSYEALKRSLKLSWVGEWEVRYIDEKRLGWDKIKWRREEVRDRNGGVARLSKRKRKRKSKRMYVPVFFIFLCVRFQCRVWYGMAASAANRGAAQHSTRRKLQGTRYTRIVGSGPHPTLSSSVSLSHLVVLAATTKHLSVSSPFLVPPSLPHTYF